MKRLLLVLVLFTFTLDAQTIRVRRGLESTRAAASMAVGEPGFTTDSLDLWMGSDSGQVLVGGRSVVYGKATFAKDAGSTDAYAITLVPAPTKYWTGMRIAFRANTANTGTASLNVNSLGAKVIYKGPAASDTLVTGDISANEVVSVVFADSAFYVSNATNASTATRFAYTPFFLETATGSAWMGAAYNQNFYPFNLNQGMTPDSVVWYFINTLAATDSFKNAIYSADGLTKLCETGWNMPGVTTSGLRYPMYFSTTTYLLPGTYRMAYSHNTNTTLATLDIVNNAQFYAAMTTRGWTGTIAPGAVFTAFPTTLSARVTLAATKVPMFLILGH